MSESQKPEESIAPCVAIPPQEPQESLSPEDHAIEPDPEPGFTLDPSPAQDTLKLEAEPLAPSDPSPEPSLNQLEITFQHIYDTSDHVQLALSTLQVEEDMAQHIDPSRVRSREVPEFGTITMDSARKAALEWTGLMRRVSVQHRLNQGLKSGMKQSHSDAVRNQKIPKDYDEFITVWNPKIAQMAKSSGLRHQDDIDEVLANINYEFLRKDALALYNPELGGSFSNYVYSFSSKRIARHKALLARNSARNVSIDDAFDGADDQGNRSESSKKVMEMGSGLLQDRPDDQTTLSVELQECRQILGDLQNFRGLIIKQEELEVVLTATVIKNATPVMEELIDQSQIILHAVKYVLQDEQYEGYSLAEGPNPIRVEPIHDDAENKFTCYVRVSHVVERSLLHVFDLLYEGLTPEQIAHVLEYSTTNIYIMIGELSRIPALIHFREIVKNITEKESHSEKISKSRRTITPKD